MVEEEKKEETKPEEKQDSIIEQAAAERKRIEEATNKLKEENDRTERLAVQRELAGKSTGTRAPEKTEQEKYEERAGERYRGTGLNPAAGYKRKF